MKSKDLQNIVLSMHQKSDTPTEVHRHLNGGISLATIKKCCQMIRQSGSVQLLGTRAVPRIARALKRLSKKLKTVCTENKRCQFENFRGNSAFRQQVSDEY